MGGNDRVWNLRFCSTNDWELAASFSFLHLIQSQFPRGTGSDGLCWSAMEVGSLTLGSFYHKIWDVTPNFPWKGIWKVKIPKRVAFFMWTVAHGQILTLDNLMLRGWQIVVVCVVVMRNLWIYFLFFLSVSSFYVDAYALAVWDWLGHAKFGCRLTLLLASLAWEL